MEAVRFLKELLAIPGVNGRDDEGAVAEFLCGFLRQAGLEAGVRRIDARHANVTAFLEGEETAHPIVWNGHLDTVPYGDLAAWETDPALPSERDGFVTARGASDMRSGLAAMVWALCEYRRAFPHCRPPRSIRFIGTCDEEKGGLGARTVLADGLMENAAALLVGEPTGCRPGTVQKGCLWLEIAAHGRTSHGAYPQEGVNAVERAVALARALSAYVETVSHPLLGPSTAQITQIEGGTAPNMTPDFCRMLLDVRMAPGLTAFMVAERANALAEEMSRETGGVFTVSLTEKNSRPAVEIAPEHPLAARLSRCIRAQGLCADPVGIGYFTDASILIQGREELPALLFGPGEPQQAHQPGERVSLALYEKAIRVFGELIREPGI